MVSERKSFPRDRQRVTDPSHMALDATTFNAVVKIMSKQPWDEVNVIMQGLLSAQPVSLEAKQNAV